MCVVLSQIPSEFDSGLDAELKKNIVNLCKYLFNTLL